MTKIIDQQLRRNDCGISAVKTVCNVLGVDMSRDVIEEHIALDEQGATLDSLQRFFQYYGFDTQYKLLDINTISGDINELNQLFPCITPVKSKDGLHYVVITRLRNRKFHILDPADARKYKLSIQAFKKKAYFSSSYLDYVDVAEKVRISVQEELKERGLPVPMGLSAPEWLNLFNKLTYFSYVHKNFGFKNEKAANAYLDDLLVNQDVAVVPQHFKSLRYRKGLDMVQIKAPILLSVKKSVDSWSIGEPSTENVYVRLVKSIRSIRDIWGIFILTTIITATITYVSVFINQILIDHILPSYEINTLTLFAIGLGVFYLFDLIFYAYKRFISIHLGNTLDKYFLKIFDEKLNAYSIQFLQSFRRGDLTERLSDSLKLKSFFMRYFSKIFINVIIALFSIGVLFVLNAKLTIIVFIVLILFAIVFYVLTPILQTLEQKRFSQKASFFSKFIEKIDGIQVIKALRLETYSSQEISSNINDLIKIQTKSKYVGLINSLLGSLIVTVASLLIIVFSAQEMMVHQTITLGMMITYIALSSKIFSAFESLLNANLSLQEHQVILNRFFDFTDKEKGSSSKQYKTDAIRHFDFKTLSLQHVAFSYADDKEVLKDINLTIEQNDRIWIQGKNGSGKSTLCKVLGLLYTASSGDILLNGVDISLYDSRRVKRQIVLISSDDLLFNNTLLFNISFGRPTDMEQLIRYAKAIGFYDFINSQADRFHMMIHENGRNLSTGQKRKVLLLRGLMSAARLVLFDEIFNGLDQASQQTTEQLMDTMKDRAFVLISHIPVATMSFTQKYVLENGELVRSL